VKEKEETGEQVFDVKFELFLVWKRSHKIMRRRHTQRLEALEVLGVPDFDE